MPEPASTPVLFDRALLRARQARAERLGPATFLRDHAIADAADRLASVNRSFVDAVDLGTPGDALGEAVRGRVASLPSTPRARSWRP